MIAFFQVAIISSGDTKVGDPDHMNTFAVLSAVPPQLPDSNEPFLGVIA
jgi:hypothetical protein